FFISFYNPNGAANWQLRMDLSTSGSFVQISGSDPAHHANAATGWNEVNLDLSTYAGQNITKIQLYPAAGNAKSIYYDNIYIASETVLSINTFDTLTNRAFISQDGRIQFTNELQNATIYVFDLKGAQILKETINGKVSQNSISKKGLYFVKIISKEGTGNYKVIFN
ncbi:MAG: T9SS type A sorting domain-containing protein, partial [Polaribacter sp.]|nr:T9SS type A sorting domain-containing protein [Polaribacter sp.]